MPTRSKYKAIIQTNSYSGINRVFVKKKVNGVSRVCEVTKPGAPFKVTGYCGLAFIHKALKNTIPVYHDEQVEYNGQNCELRLFGE